LIDKSVSQSFSLLLRFPTLARLSSPRWNQPPFYGRRMCTNFSFFMVGISPRIFARFGGWVPLRGSALNGFGCLGVFWYVVILLMGGFEIVPGIRFDVVFGLFFFFVLIFFCFIFSLFFFNLYFKRGPFLFFVRMVHLPDIRGVYFYPRSACFFSVFLFDH